ncbi:MAG: Na(+)-translocating NADH-quinone reductase subunit C [Polyangiaceae bacterium]|nr:Na(+)-translocating NADH-quinone reductase subunit C [Polyangiaceae bacterium]
MDKNSTSYTVIFAAGVCLVCGAAVASAAVGLHSRQETNKIVDRKSKVLAAAGLLPENATADLITKLYAERVVPQVYTLKSGQPAADIDAATYSMQAEMKDPAHSQVAPPNAAQVARLPEHGVIYEIKDEGKTASLVLPVEGKGLWSTLYGFLALDKNTVDIKGLIFYQHGETPGLGGEVDNPAWQALWDGRKAFDSSFTPKIQVIKGKAGAPATDPYDVDGLSGATITSRGVTHLLQYWLGEQGFGPVLKGYRSNRK